MWKTGMRRYLDAVYELNNAGKINTASGMHEEHDIPVTRILREAV